ncbi:MAG: exodeoxyribonuclease V subunit gamma [Anaerolineaceae bacterium]|nr:exodeoxyribonuclease V subunit gamma [Anaerolineaceae bacterium]
MSVELVIAPPAAGKTETCIQRIRDIQSTQPLARVWVVVPDRYQAAAFRRRLAGTGGALGVQVGRFEDLNQSILEHAGTYVPAASFSLVHRLIQETVDEAVAQGELPHFAPLQLFPGFILALRDSFAELKRAVVTPEQFSEFARTGSAAQQDLAILYSRYQSCLRELQWADAEDINWLAASALEQFPSAAADIQLLIVDGFDSFNGAQYQVLNLLSGQVGEMLITIPGLMNSDRTAHRRFTESIERLVRELSPQITVLENSPYLPAVFCHIEQHLFESEAADRQSSTTPIFLEARSPADEAREALRWVKKLVVRKKLPISNCMIFTPNPAVYHPLLRACADEFGIPIRFTLDESLDKSPAVTALMNLLSLPVKNFNSRYLFIVLRSPYFEFPFDTETVDILEMVSRVAQIIEGWEQWREAWERLIASTEVDRLDLEEERNSPCLPRGSTAAALSSLIESVFKTITPPEKTCSQSEWIAWLEDVLENLQFYERADSERDRSACEVFREVLRSLVLSESVAGARQVEYHQFLADLQGTLRGQRFRETTLVSQPALLVGRMTEARGTRFQAVALLGFSEGSFPVNEHPDPFLDEDLRSALGLESRLRRDQAGLFYQAVTRSDQYLLITRPYLSGDGEHWEVSSYWSAVKSLFDGSAMVTVKPDRQQPLADAASSQELLFSAVRRRSLPQKYDFLSERWHDLQHAKEVLQARRSKGISGPHEGFVESLIPTMNQRYSPSAIWSSSRLETYGNCPFQFFVKHALNLEPRMQPELGLDASQLGSILHEVLEETYKKADNPHELPAVLESLRKEAEKIFSKAPRKYGFRPSPLWEVEKAQLFKKLKITVCALAEDSNWVPFAYEEKFGLGGALSLEINLGGENLKIRGVIDRVDRNGKGQLRVIDYKTGGSHLAASDLKNGYRLQLPIYAMAARDALGLGIPVDGMYWKILAAEAGSLKLARFSTESTNGVEAAIEVVQEHLLRIITGIHSAEFPPQSPEGGCPSYCPAAKWCWRYESSW